MIACIEDFGEFSGERVDERELAACSFQRSGVYLYTPLDMEGDVVNFPNQPLRISKPRRKLDRQFLVNRSPSEAALGGLSRVSLYCGGNLGVNGVYPIEFSMVIACVEFRDRKRSSMISKPPMNVSAIK